MDDSILEPELAEPEQEEQANLDPSSLGLDLPADPEAAIRILLTELASSRAEAAAHLDDLRRVAANFDNFRKRTQREMTDNVERASHRVLARLLPVLDSLELAAARQPESESETKLADGIRSTQRQLLDELAKEGLQPIASIGEEFNPHLHQAVGASGDGRLLVVEEIRRGYLLAGRVLRPALVVVASEP